MLSAITVVCTDVFTTAERHRQKIRFGEMPVRRETNDLAKKHQANGKIMFFSNNFLTVEYLVYFFANLCSAC
jgi:hypothetical protein